MRGAREEPPQSAARHARLEPAGPRRTALCQPPERQCDRNRALRSLAPAGFQDCRRVPLADRGNLRTRLIAVILKRKTDEEPDCRLWRSLAVVHYLCRECPVADGQGSGRDPTIRR